MLRRCFCASLRRSTPMSTAPGATASASTTRRSTWNLDSSTSARSWSCVRKFGHGISTNLVVNLWRGGCQEIDDRDAYDVGNQEGAHPARKNQCSRHSPS